MVNSRQVSPFGHGGFGGSLKAPLNGAQHRLERCMAGRPQERRRGLSAARPLAREQPQRPPRPARRSRCRVREYQRHDARTRSDDTQRVIIRRHSSWPSCRADAPAIGGYREGCNGRENRRRVRCGISLPCQARPRTVKTRGFCSRRHSLPAATSGGSNDFKNFLQFYYPPSAGIVALQRRGLWG